jgi:hypothetical protein
MKCIKCLELIHDEATKCQDCKSWQSRTGEIPRITENIIMIVLFSILMIPVIYMANNMAEDRFSELNYTARFMVLEEYSKENKIDSWGDYRVNSLNYFKLKSRYDAIRYVSKLSLNRKIINSYSHGPDFINFYRAE